MAPNFFVNMNDTWLIYFMSTLLLIFLTSKLLTNKKTWQNLPPSPPSLPIIGNLHLLKKPIHRTLQNMSLKYGPIISLSFGTKNVLIVSSPSLVEECFNKNDLVFANRPQTRAGKHLHYNHTTLGATNYGNHWRNLRRLAAVEVFSTNRVNMSLSIRQQEVKFLVKSLFQVSGTGFCRVEMNSKLQALAFNVIMRITAGKRYYGLGVEDVEEGKRFRETIRKIFDTSGVDNPGDFVPILRWLEFNGKEKRLVALKREMDEVMQGLVDEKREGKKKGSFCLDGDKSMIDSLLSLQQSDPEYYSDDIIKGLVMTMLTAGTDTSSVTIEWAMTLLLNHPTVIKRAQEELDFHVGNDRLVEESDFPKLPYLQNIINETLRLYPAAPLLVAHESSDDCTVGGYYVQRGTMLLVNAWALHRDPKVWKDPTSFKPERYEGVEIEHYKLIPFGLGRRACPGAGLANRVVSLTLAALIQCFEWERIGMEEVDTTEGQGLTMPKAKPLEAICKAREVMVDVLKQL